MLNNLKQSNSPHERGYCYLLFAKPLSINKLLNALEKVVGKVFSYERGL